MIYIVSEVEITLLSPLYKAENVLPSWMGRGGERRLGTLPEVISLQFSLDQFSRSVVSDSLRRHGSQHARPPSPSPTPGIYSNSCPSSQ